MNTRARWTLFAAAAAFLIACSSGKKGGGGDPGGSGSIAGTVTYDFVPSTLGATLDFAHATERPVRNAVVQVMRGNTVLATTSTNAQGQYSVSYTDPGGSGQLVVAALARTSGAPVIQVQDNTDGNAVWAVGGAITTSTTAANIHATHGWTGSGYGTTTRMAAPFAILDSMYTAAMKFVEVRPAVAFPDLAVNWSPDNTTQSGANGPDYPHGLIGTSHFSPSANQIFILGKDGVDTDEFDTHVIVHEWAHYFEHNLSRSDSIGGPHGAGDVLDPRVAFGEGYGNALAAMLLPETMYVDTYWSGGALHAFGFDAEAPPPAEDATPGVFSEVNIMRLLYDVFDPANEAFDGVAAGLGVIYDVLTGPERTTDALTTVGSFVTGLKAQAGVSATAVDTLLAHYHIGAITSEWGAGDAQLASMYASVAALPATCGAGCNQTGPDFALGGGFDYNKWEQNQYFVFTGNGGPMTITATSTQDVALIVYRAGEQVASADANYSGTETVQMATTTNGALYVVNLIGFGATTGNYLVNVRFTR